MEQSEVWAAIDDQRRALVLLLDDLSEQEWRQPSLCEGWTVRQVAAHLALQNTTWRAMPRAVLTGRCQRLRWKSRTCIGAKSSRRSTGMSSMDASASSMPLD